MKEDETTLKEVIESAVKMMALESGLDTLNRMNLGKPSLQTQAKIYGQLALAKREYKLKQEERRERLKKKFEEED